MSARARSTERWSRKHYHHNIIIVTKWSSQYLSIARLRRDRFTRGANHVRRRAQAVLADRVELLLRTGEHKSFYSTLTLVRYLTYLTTKQLQPSPGHPIIINIYYYWIETAAAAFVNELPSVSCVSRSNPLPFWSLKNSRQYQWVGTIVEHFSFIAVLSSGGGRSIVVRIGLPPAVHCARGTGGGHTVCVRILQIKQKARFACVQVQYRQVGRGSGSRYDGPMLHFFRP